MDSIEHIIGYSFRNRELLIEALTHPSRSYESKRSHPSNQRLEFLGDAVLQLTLSHKLFDLLADAAEGDLTKARAHLVSMRSLAALARHFHLGAHLRMGRGEEATQGRERDSTLADALEAVIGAVYLDGGYAEAKRFIGRLFADALKLLKSGPIERNPKGQLQEMLQALGDAAPNYSIVAQEGPDHARSFEARVSWQGEFLGQGTGRSKKDAEVKAAQAALESLEAPGRLPALKKRSGKATKKAGKACAKPGEHPGHH